MISDTGGPLASGTSFYYNFGNIDSSDSFKPTNSFAPGPEAVSSFVQKWRPDHIVAVGDLAYNVGASTLADTSIGLYYNNYIHPYPSPNYLKGDYLSINGKTISRGQKSWPYNVYDFPNGFPNPIAPNRRGGSPTRRNRFWASLGNHDYGQEVGYGQPGVTPYNYSGQPTGAPVGPSSTSSLQSSIDYFIPFLEKPELLGSDKARLNIGHVDKSGNSGAYYSIKLGGTPDQPLVEVFQTDTERLNANAGYENWNTAQQGGMKKRVEDANGTVSFVNEIRKQPNLLYDPTIPYDANKPYTIPLKGTTTDLNNGYKQFQWLKQSIEQSKAKWKIVTGHHPGYAGGRWADAQPDSHMSNPHIQRLLNALPKGSFDAYYSGENHFYERTLETKAGGIGLGVPFIVNGNNGRNLEAKIQIPYGGSPYFPPIGGFAESKNKNNPYENPNKKAIEAKALLDSDPVIAGSSGLARTAANDPRNYANGLYGYGFGFVKLDASDDHMLFHYQETPVVDPAIANHLKGGKAPETGFRETKASDWVPQTGGSFNSERDLARFSLSITDGVVKGVTLEAQGNGYMRSKNGNYVVKGFNVYGNNFDIAKPWHKTAQVDLTFSQGKLTDVKLTDGGQGYELAVKAALENNNATTTDGITNPDQKLMVGLNYNIDETQYGVRDPDLYNDWYLITDTRASVKLQGTPGRAGFLEVQMVPKSEKARQLLSGGLKPTTGYSGNGAQRATSVAQSGAFQLYDKQKLIASGTLSNGLWRGYLDKLPSNQATLSYRFEGDPITSYNVNFKASEGTVKPSFSRGLSGGSDSRLRSNPKAPLAAAALKQTTGSRALVGRPLAAETISPFSHEPAGFVNSPWTPASSTSQTPI